MDKRRQKNRNLLILFGPVGTLALLVLTIFLSDQRADVTSARKESVAGQVGAPEPADVGPNDAAAAGPAAAPAAVITGQRPVSPVVDEAFARTGLPAQVRAFPRGPNGERRYNAPVISAMPEASRAAPPVPLAMSPLDGRVELLAEEIDLHTKTARRMVLDVAALEEVIAGKTSRILAPLPDGSAILLRIDAVRNRAGMTFTLDGEVEGEPQTSVVQLVVHDGILHGTVARYHIDQHLEYRILSSGYMMVRDLDSSTMSDTCGNPGEEDALPDEGTAPDSPAGGDPAPDTPGYVTIDVVVGYDQGARVADGGVSQMEARIIGSVDRMNDAFSNSQVTSTELMLLGTIEDPDYVFPGAVAGSMSSNDELGNLNDTSSTNPALNTVSDYANALGADLRAFIVKQADGSAGIAFRPGTSSITARDYMTTSRITFAHELGHNIGARHSWGDSSSDGATTVHSYGWRLAPAGQTRVRTIMAYDWGWGSGARIPYFANPDVTYQGARTGQVDGYNATGDSLSDPRYVSGGFEGTHGNGFNGSNPQLGARNAHFILAQAPGRANLRTRTSFQVVTPLTSALYQPGETREIYWTGGDYLDTATITLYKDGLLHSTLATGLSGDERRFSWVIPGGIPQGGGYFVRVTRNGNLVADSGNFSIGSAGPQPQTITFAAIAEQLTTASFTLSATGGASGNPVTFAVTAGPAVIGPTNVVSFVGAGSVTITASQAGNANYLPAADVARTFSVTKATATVTLSSLAQTYTGTARTVSALTNPTSLPVTFTYNGVSTPPVNAGNHAVVGTVNSAMYQGSAAGTLVVAKAPASVTLSNLNQVYNGSPRSIGLTIVPAGLSYTLTYDGFSAAPINAGTYPISVIINDTNYAGSASGTLNVSQAGQTILFPPLADTLTTATVSLAATGGSAGNPVTYSVTEGPGQITGGNLLGFTGAGVVRVVASQAGNSNYFAATPVERTLTVSKAPAQIILSRLSPVYNGSPQGVAVATVPAGLGYTVSYAGGATEPTNAGTYPLVVTINDQLYEGAVTDDFVIEKAAGQVTLSGLARTYSGAPQGASATTDPPGAPVVFTYDGLPALPVAAGSYAVVATINHPSIEGTASGTLVIAKAPQVIDFDEILPQFATDTVLLSATGGDSNNPVIFAVTEGPAAISGGNSLTFSGSGDVSIQATQAGDDNHLAATPVSRSFTVSKFPATVTLTNLAQAYDGSPRVAGVTTSPSGLNTVISYDGSPDPPVRPGSYFVIAYIDEAFYEGDTADNLVVSKGTQTIDFPALPTTPANETLTLSATGGGSESPVIFEVRDGPGVITGRNQLSFSAPGTVTVVASQAGDARYNAATPVERTMTVDKSVATVTFVELSATYDGGPQSAAATTVPPGLTVTYTYDGLGTEPVNAGSYAVVATIDDLLYQGSATETFVVNKAGQSIVFPPIPPRVTTDTVNLSATGGPSGSPVTFSVSNGPGVITGGTILSFTGAGEVAITATQDGGVNYLPAPPAGQIVLVTKAAATLTLAPLRQVRDGSPREVIVTTEPPGLGHAVIYDGEPEAPIGIGRYNVTATLADPLYQGSVNGTLVVDDPASMILVPGGELPALSSIGLLEQPSFELSRYEVTWGLWREVRDWAAANGYDIGSRGAGCADDHPVRSVNWYDAVKWCNARTERENALTGSTLAPAYRVAGDVYRTGEPALITDIVCDFSTSGYRIPTRSEWEYAARGGEGSPPRTYPGGENPALVAWHAANAGGATCDLSNGRGTYPVAYKTANASGFHDLAGNIAEWNWDSDPGDASDRLVAGGSWDSAVADLALAVVASELPTLRDDRIGLRVGRSVALAIGEAVDLSASEWDSGVNSAWLAQTGITSDGIDAAASGPLPAGGETYMQTILTGPGNVNFRWKINLPAEFGKLRISVGGINTAEIAGDSGWAETTAYVPPGDQIVRWTFIRTVPAGPAPDPADTGAWLDEVVYTPATVPEVTTFPASAVDSTSAVSGGEVTSDGGSPVTVRGLVMGISPDPALGAGGMDFPASIEAASEFGMMLSPLLEGTTYYVRAYASSAAGTGYGESRVFTTDTSLSLPGGFDEVSRSILPGDRQVFHFSLAGPRKVNFSTLGGGSLRAELYDREGAVIASFAEDSEVLFDAILHLGDYSLHLFRLPGAVGIARTFELTLDATVIVETRPDVAVGSSLNAAAGGGIYNTTAGQLVGYTSVKAGPVSALASFRNAGTLPDELLISGTPGNALFGVVYTNASANITAQVISGTYRTPVITASNEASWIRVTVTPNKKKLMQQKKGKRPKILKRSQLLQIRASSTFDPALTDTGYINVQTK